MSHRNYLAKTRGGPRVQTCGIRLKFRGWALQILLVWSSHWAPTVMAKTRHQKPASGFVMMSLHVSLSFSRKFGLLVMWARRVRGGSTTLLTNPRARHALSSSLLFRIFLFSIFARALDERETMVINSFTHVAPMFQGARFGV